MGKPKGSNKKALRGLSRVKLFPVVQNDFEGYETGEGFFIPEVQSMTRTADVSRNTIYADDGIYMELVEFNGLNLEITVAEISLERMAQLGFGEFDAETGVLDYDPQGQSLEFGLTFRALKADGNYRMYKMPIFMVTEVAESNLQTKGEGGNISSYIIKGVVTARKFDDRDCFQRDSEDEADLTWLDTIPQANKAAGVAAPASFGAPAPEKAKK